MPTTELSEPSPPWHLWANQNQLFARFIELCGKYHIKKPSRYLLNLLQEDDRSRKLRLLGEAAQLQLQYNELPEVESDTAASMAARAEIAPLAASSRLSFPANSEFLGARGVCVLLELIGELPALQYLDLSGVGNVYMADQFKQGPCGNDVMALLCQVATAHCSLREIDIQGHTIGTVAGVALLELVRANPRIESVLYVPEGVDVKVHEKIQLRLAANREHSSSLPPITYPTCISEHMKRLAYVDRKTSQERLQLRQLVWDLPSFRGVSEQEIDLIVEHASVVSLQQAVKVSRGLRGDDENMFLIVSGEIQASIGSDKVQLARGHYYGEVTESAVCSAGTVREVTRGVAYRLPMAVCTGLFALWESRVVAMYDKIYRTPCFQSLPLWCLYHACHDADLRRFPIGSEVISAGDGFAGLFVVVSGTFSAAGRHGEVTFTKGDVFGQEPLVGKHKTSSVSVTCLGGVAGDASGESGVHAGGAEGVCVAVHSDLVCGPLKPVLKALARQYSTHDDLSSTPAAVM